jgi:hypothetical protein
MKPNLDLVEISYADINWIELAEDHNLLVRFGALPLNYLIFSPEFCAPHTSKTGAFSILK